MRAVRSVAVRRLTVAVMALTLVACDHAEPGKSTSRAAPPGALRAEWRWVAPPPSYVGMPGADAAGVAVTYGHSHVALLDRSGTVRWTADRLELRDVAPVLTPDAVLVAAEDGLAAFDRASGALRWAATVGERANAPVVVGGRALVTTWEGSLLAVDTATGRIEWRVSLPGPALGPPAAVASVGSGGDTAVASWEGDDGDGAGVVAVDAATGRQRWWAPLAPGGVSGPGAVVPAGGGPAVIVVVAGDIAAHGLAVDSGAERWRLDLQGAGSPEVVPLDAGGGAALVAHRLGGMVLIDAADGRPRWQVSSDGAAIRGGPAGPGPGGRFALPLDDGRLLLAGPDRPTTLAEPPGRVSGVARGADGTLLMGLREAADNDLSASTGW
jgi:outer membrane protein assembly factor BamB